METLDALGAIWPIAFGFVTLVIVLAKMHSDIEQIKEKVREQEALETHAKQLSEELDTLSVEVDNLVTQISGTRCEFQALLATKEPQVNSTTLTGRPSRYPRKWLKGELKKRLQILEATHSNHEAGVKKLRSMLSQNKDAQRKVKKELSGLTAAGWS